MALANSSVTGPWSERVSRWYFLETALECMDCMSRVRYRKPGEGEILRGSYKGTRSS